MSQTAEIKKEGHVCPSIISGMSCQKFFKYRYTDTNRWYFAHSRIHYLTLWYSQWLFLQNTKVVNSELKKLQFFMTLLRIWFTSRSLSSCCAIVIIRNNPFAFLLMMISESWFITATKNAVNIKSLIAVTLWSLPHLSGPNIMVYGVLSWKLVWKQTISTKPTISH